MKLIEYLQSRPTFFLGTIMIIASLVIIGMLIFIWKKLEDEKKVAKAALELNRITNSIRAGLVNFIYEDNLKITYASRGFFDLLGYDKNDNVDIDKQYIYDYVDPRDRSILCEIEKQLDLGNINLEIRMNTKCGQVIDVLINGNSVEGRDGKHTISAIFVDISQQKLMQELILLEGERYRVAAELSNDVLFEYYVENDEMVYTEKYKEIFGKHTTVEEFHRKCNTRKDMIHADDWGIYLELCSDLISGKGFIQAEFRMKDRMNSFIWCQVMGKTIYDEQKRPIRVIGKIVNVDTQKRELEALEFKATRDPLTGVYNKEIIIKKIEKYLGANRNKNHVLLFVDVDDFKKTNDNYGHLLGDKVLVTIVNRLRDVFSEGELIGRIGGDEFIVFAGDIDNKQEIIDKAQSLVDELDAVHLENGITIPASLSIGMSIYPEDGMQYEQLIACADKAMYEAKKHGKRGLMVYCPLIENLS